MSAERQIPDISPPPPTVEGIGQAGLSQPWKEWMEKLESQKAGKNPSEGEGDPDPDDPRPGSPGAPTPVG
ncbi:hypothetical protein TWF281_010357 [Arthrobotrys megalospora]